MAGRGLTGTGQHRQVEQSSCDYSSHLTHPPACLPGFSGLATSSLPTATHQQGVGGTALGQS